MWRLAFSINHFNQGNLPCILPYSYSFASILASYSPRCYLLLR
ncbi:hypothetical protein CAter282_1090 [Collimonas arenae]|uniref:Uncharacterized protein n=1 Tax=Collimonas arenae TaxID=279058 RepID=A0A127QGE9_9BURK|nr:hypothetical protein CAter10_1180 [Collimonas arenae]AMP08885.1 hypothetical protein CAter282_1090 [Collimonas arenae]